MSQNPEEPRENPAEDKDFESGLDYGAFISDAPDFPEDHLDTPPSTDQNDAAAEEPSESTPAPTAAPPVGVPGAAATSSPDKDEQPTEVVSPAPAAASPVGGEDQPTAVVSPAADEQATTVVPPPAVEQSTTALPREERAEQTSVLAPPPAQEEPPALSSEPAVTAPPAQPGTPAQSGPVPPSEDELQEEVEKSKRGVSRFFTVLIAIFAPLVFAVVAIRMVASPLFLWFTYWRPGFPQDTGGWDLQERLLYGSYGVDFLFNGADSRYLGQLAPAGEPLFTDAEVSHMADVKFLIFYAVIIAASLAALGVLFGLLLRKWRPGGFSRGMFAGAWVTIALVAAAVALPLIIGWNRFFTEFHNLFFPQGNWSFASESALIRLYPNQFWIDAGIWLGGLLLLLSLVTLMITWPTKRRRARRAERLAEVHERKRAKLQGELENAAATS